MWGPGPLIPGPAFVIQVSVSCALSTREQMYSIFAFCVQPFVISFYGSQLLMSLMATMMAMITMSTTRMMSRMSVRPRPSSEPEDPLPIWL